MPLRWRVDPLDLLKEHGYTTYRIRKEKIFAESSVKNMRYKKHVSWKDLEHICEITGKQPGKLIEYVKEPKDTGHVKE